MNDILAIAGGAFLLVFAAVHYWLKWSEKSDADKQGYIHDLVMAAEQLYGSADGQAKFNYVMSEVKKRWPSFPDQIVRNLIEAAVFRIKGFAE